MTSCSNQFPSARAVTAVPPVVRTSFMTKLRRCIPAIVVTDLAKVARFLTENVGFAVDPRSCDDVDPDSQRILVRDDIEIRLFSSAKIQNIRASDSTLVFECDDCQYWNDLLVSRGFNPVFNHDIGDALTVTCYVTDEFTVEFEQVGTR
jgi:hypothetical protein